MAIDCSSTYFTDPQGRVVLLRGVSLSASSKLPATPDLPTHSPDAAAFLNHRNVSFVGRPFSLQHAHEHLSRLQNWGFELIRLIVTWESLEHAGWQQYDDEYIAFLREIIALMPKYNLKCIIDAHQDVWSRHTGGSGAPCWTLEIAGFDVNRLQASYAAHSHNLSLDATGPGPEVWPTGYQKLAPATMATLFWAGDIFAWRKTVEGQGIGTFLQDACCAAFARLAKAIQDCPAVIGFEPMNEPHRGYIELHSMSTFSPMTDLSLCYAPSAIQSFALGDGIPTSIPYCVPSFPHPTRISRYALVNTSKTRAWFDDQPCIWRQHGVWEVNRKTEQPIVLCQDYFEKDPRNPDHKIEWYKDCWYPFLQKFREAITGGEKWGQNWWTVAAGIPNELTPEWPADLQPKNLISAPHFYDLHSLFSRTFGNITFNIQGLSRGMNPLKAIYIGRKGVRANYRLQIRNIKQASDASTGRPCVIGETGISMQSNSRYGVLSGNYRWQSQQLDAILHACESNFTSYILWNYNTHNCLEWGDGWNAEDFSIFNPLYRDQGRDDGARTPEVVQRPYARRVAGIPISTNFDVPTSLFSFKFRNPGSTDAIHHKLQSKTTEIYLPKFHYATEDQLLVQVSDGYYTIDLNNQVLTYTHENTTPGYEHHIQISLRRIPSQAWRIKRPDIDLDFGWIDWGIWSFALAFLLVALYAASLRSIM